MEQLEKYLDTYDIPKNIVIVSGAGASAGSGFPTYRTFGNNSTMGIITDQTLLNKSPLYQQIVQLIHTAEPCEAHRLAVKLNDMNLLKRVYTQNIDGMYQKAGLPNHKIVEFHGSIKKNDVVLYGQDIPAKVQNMVNIDFVEDGMVDMMLVMGTSLQVAPFCAIPNLVHKNCVRILINIQPEHAMVNNFNNIKYSSWTKFGKRKVSLRQNWSTKNKWKHQFIIRMSADEFSVIFVNKILDCYKNNTTNNHIPNEVTESYDKSINTPEKSTDVYEDDTLNAD